MKKIISFISALLLMASAFASCGRIEDDEAAETGSKSSSSVDKSDDNDENDEDNGKDEDDNKSSEKDSDSDDYDNYDYDNFDDNDDSKPSERSDNDITGIWFADDASMTELFGDVDDEFVFESMTMELTENEIRLDATIDMSEIWHIQGDKFVMYGESFSYDYDGKIMTLDFMGRSLMEFKRVGNADADNVYGKYTCDDFDDLEDGEYVIDFPEDNIAYMMVSMVFECSYDEETGKLTVTNMDGEVEEMDVEISGDNMYMTDEDGELTTFIRKK